MLWWSEQSHLKAPLLILTFQFAPTTEGKCQETMRGGLYVQQLRLFVWCKQLQDNFIVFL